MKTRNEILEMASQAKGAAGWTGEESRRPVEGKDAEERAYAEGVEAGLLWAAGHAGSPFPR